MKTAARRTACRGGRQWQPAVKQSFRLFSGSEQSSEDLLTEETKEAVIAKANLVEHLRNIDAACDDARLSAVEKIKRIKEEIEKAQACMKRLSL